MGRKPNTQRSDITTKSQPSKAKQRNEDYLKYRKYLRSKQFKEVKAIVAERDGHKCMTCGRKRSDGAQLCTHHRSYEHLFQGGEIEADDCILLCRTCHKMIHSARGNYQRFKRKISGDEPQENEGE